MTPFSREPSFGLFSNTTTTRPESRYGNGRSSAALKMLNTVALPPTANDTIRTTAAENPVFLRQLLNAHVDYGFAEPGLIGSGSRES